MPNLTKSLVEKLLPKSVDYVVWDDKLKGFGVKVTPVGRKSYLLKYRTKDGRQRKPAIGEHSEALPCEKARDIARDKSLNDAYKAKIKHFEDNVKFAEGEFETKSYKDALGGLRKAQRLWVQYRDKSCSSVLSSYGLGNGGANASWECMTLNTAQRTLQLLDE